MSYCMPEAHAFGSCDCWADEPACATPGCLRTPTAGTYCEPCAEAAAADDAADGAE